MPPGTPFWPFAPWPPKWTRFDVIANALAYVPFGMFVALIPRRASPLLRAGIALAAGVALSFGMETLQMFLPTRDANLVDLFANAGGAFAGGLLGGTLVRARAHATAGCPPRGTARSCPDAWATSASRCSRSG